MIDYIKHICFELINSLDFSDFVIGKVISTNPIQIKISDKVILNENQIILTRNVSDFVTEQTQNPENYTDVSNDNDYKKRIKVTTYNRLEAGEMVAIIKDHSGQRFLVIDRVSGGD